MLTLLAVRLLVGVLLLVCTCNPTLLQMCYVPARLGARPAAGLLLQVLNPLLVAPAALSL